MALIQFKTDNYADFNLLIGRFKPEVSDVYYKNKPYEGTGPGPAEFTAWAFDYASGFLFMLAISQNVTTGTPSDATPSAFLTDFPEAIALSSIVNIVFG